MASDDDGLSGMPVCQNRQRRANSHSDRISRVGILVGNMSVVSLGLTIVISQYFSIVTCLID